jgi:hypothetical protein
MPLAQKQGAFLFAPYPVNKMNRCINYYTQLHIVSHPIALLVIKCHLQGNGIPFDLVHTIVWRLQIAIRRT